MGSLGPGSSRPPWGPHRACSLQQHVQCPASALGSPGHTRSPRVLLGAGHGGTSAHEVPGPGRKAGGPANPSVGTSRLGRLARSVALSLRDHSKSQVPGARQGSALKPGPGKWPAVVTLPVHDGRAPGSPAITRGPRSRGAARQSRS